jgi:hypothetical protein
VIMKITPLIKTPVSTPGILTFPTHGGLPLEVKFLFCTEIMLRILITTLIRTLGTMSQTY